ncbi:hypothetical protein DUNSADRAFT_6436 [Dunaliella salina]|uniref:Uncharacterized protein n=1 Tax=Dunaliella salina TaxID=3046 RepID=A0ABQ7H6V7_DUNSA|nr:hypothetical protein DUNSADRAFT_6436 [Dunaliella salina]|eukprot:KAF5842588.1 hypothetical protein DUNSADRAFT_6436 [Dunaliella salina]
MLAMSPHVELQTMFIHPLPLMCTPARKALSFLYLVCPNSVSSGVCLCSGPSGHAASPAHVSLGANACWPCSVTMRF